MESLEKRIEEMEKKITVLTNIVEERFGIEIDFRDEVEKFIDDFVNEVSPPIH